MSKKVMVIAPHADDEVLGCGATICKHRAVGDIVKIVISTNAALGAPEMYRPERIELVRAEARQAHAVLGVNESYFLDFPAPALDAFPSYKISRAFSQLFEQYVPDVLYLPYPGDLHQDHQVIYRAALVAARPNSAVKVMKILCYETLSETEWTPVISDRVFAPNYFVDITDYFAVKARAMMCFTSQLRDFPHSRSIEALESLSKYRGATIGVRNAEAFVIERQIW